ncbi:Desiccation-related protein PCC13-62 [Coccomyxa sp. Obi]|nr:Desiccation-related protein PCC13-62 [Coccomyxa sp. Obi]
MKVSYIGAVLALLAVSATAQPFLPGTGFLPLGNLRTTDTGGPYNISLLTVQANEIKGALAAKQNFTDKDIVHFLTNVECLEGLFDTWGTFGHGFNNNLTLGGPVPIGARKASLSDAVQPFMEEVALNEQGHALFTRQAGGDLPCPPIDFTGGFNKYFGAAYNLTGNDTIESKFGAPFDPFLNDECFLLSVLSLEELGATGNKGLTGLITNPVLANGVAGLATSATAQATVQRMLLWQIRNNTVYPFNETVQQVFARISALRDSLDGPQMDDQGLVNTDPRTIAVPEYYVNMIPTDIRGLTFSRTPQQIINIVTLGSPDGVGVFFPKGLYGAINKPTGFNVSASGLDSFPSSGAKVASQLSTQQIGTLPGPMLPSNVTGELDLTQSLTGALDNGTAATRGYTTSPSGMPFFSNATQVAVAYPLQSSSSNGSFAYGGRRLF